MKIPLVIHCAITLIWRCMKYDGQILPKKTHTLVKESQIALHWGGKVLTFNVCPVILGKCKHLLQFNKSCEEVLFVYALVFFLRDFRRKEK